LLAKGGIDPFALFPLACRLNEMKSYQQEARMQPRTWITSLVGAVIIGGALDSASKDTVAQGSAFECTDRSVAGTYGAQVQGTRPVPGNPAAGIESFNGVVIRTYDGAGGFTQIDNVKGAIAGIVPDRPGSGTYEVRPNCTMVAQLQPAPGVLIEERLVILHDGSELRSMTASPLAIMATAVHKRIDRR
jgi:hypothetical protein